MQTVAEERTPTRSQALAFGFKAACFRARRALREFGKRPRQLSRERIDPDLPVIAESRSLLYTSQLGAEFALQAGKVHNLRVAARLLDGLSIPAGETFSFWHQVPRPTRRRGFVAGRELREGCVIPNVGGGLCQLSNALYDVALQAGLEIVERHAHSRVLPGSMAAHGRDATIFWNYVDLRFRAHSDLQLEVVLGRGELVVRFRSNTPPPAATATATATATAAPPVNTRPGDAVESCETCGITSCFRHPETLDLDRAAVSAWLVDAYWPEHNQYLRQHRTEQDWLFVPSTGGRYAWDGDGFAARRSAPWLAARRSITSRRLATQGARRQRALLRFDESLAKCYARRLPPAATHLVISQNLLPFLWRDGALGGRSFDLLMTRLPMTELQAALDRAAVRWPDSPTLADFRADPELPAAEQAALAAARSWITPHSEVARLAGDRAIKLDWVLPDTNNSIVPGERLLFPSATLGRKGAWELRELAKSQPITISGSGVELESPGFWDGIEIERRPGSNLEGVRALVLPAWVENQPRRLLKALAAGIPVIASNACGLEGVAGVTTVPAGDIDALLSAVEELADRARA